MVVIESDEEELTEKPVTTNIAVKSEGSNIAALEVNTSKPFATDLLPPIKQEKVITVSEAEKSGESAMTEAENCLHNQILQLIRKKNELNSEEASAGQLNISPTPEFLAKRTQDLNRRQQAHKSGWTKSLAPITDYTTLRADVAARVNQTRNSNFKGTEDFIPLAGPSESGQLVTQPDNSPKESEYIPFCVQPGMSAISTMADFIPVKQECSTHIKHEPSSYGSQRLLSLREKHEFKYSYHDIITGTFNEKLDEELAKGVTINQNSGEIKYLSDKYYTEYNNMIQEDKYKEMLKFRQKLPAYYSAKELLEVINNNSAVVISGETGCGKSTQVINYVCILYTAYDNCITLCIYRIYITAKPLKLFPNLWHQRRVKS